MQEKHIRQIESQLPAGENIDRMYSAAEGGIRVITVDATGAERRYAVSYDAKADKVTIRRF